MTTDLPRETVLSAVLYGITLATPLEVNGKRITRIRLRRLTGRDIRRITDLDECRDEAITLSGHVPESVVAAMCEADKALAIAAIAHLSGGLIEVAK